MLRTLKIKNLALVDDVQVGFSEGLNVITGETGAGKSLMIGALRLLLGERADKSLIRTGETSCSVHAEFGLEDCRAVDAILEDVGLEPCDGGLLIIRRVITGTSNRTTVNDESVTLNALKRLGEVLVDMHGPYDHQSLLDQHVQLEILDAFGQIDHSEYQEHYRKYRDVQKQIEALNSDNEEDLQRQIEFLDYRVNEIESANLNPEEEAEVEEEHSKIANAQHVIELANGTVQALTEGEGCAFEGLVSAQQALNQLIKLMPEAQDWHDELESAVTSVQEVVRSIEQSAGDIDASAERMEWLDDRLTTYQTLKRKYGTTVEEVLENGAQWAEQLKELRGRDKKREKLENQLTLIFQDLDQTGAKLRAARENVADHLSECITRELVDIGFEHGFFDVQITPCDPTPTGMDTIDFGFAPNAGEDMRPLRMIASSGEISRVMLATKAVLAKQDQIPVLVFDEIDANIGGEIGGAVGRKLAEVARHHQLLCITHLPQVAACGNRHLAVSKKVEDGRTFTEVELLDDETRPEELARMLGGKDSTNVTLQHAREMLEQTSFL
ncbi:DNA repair protein RecN [Pontiella agarivorans]|uniref:DNA repair protein RecN n=1 Tax=Pontiella agarivorans TaxID=3038953 RepID=A0ABU5N0Y7_9BACT|nr:DNA repair protein RecN [Pontiella agarivorans]MDZ8120097.1 DNA repair protein RecN [Pontiella agarivorans]